jgi:hypothetical protein
MSHFGMLMPRTSIGDIKTFLVKSMEAPPLYKLSLYGWTET